MNNHYDHLKPVHDGLFELLKAFDTFCTAHDIEYFLDSGTLLGAVRHKDFIPWDDDVDLTMKRAEFEKLLAVKDEIPAPFKLVMPEEYGGYFFDFVPRVINTEFPLREETDADRAQNNCQNRLALDIFILDNAPDSDAAFKAMVFRQKMIYGEAMHYRYDKALHAHSFLNRMKVSALSFLGGFRKLATLRNKQYRLSTKYNGENTQYLCGTNHIVSWLDKRFPAVHYASTVRLTIRDAEFYCPVGYHELLTQMYGDYMTPPPEAERRPIHVDGQD